MLGCTFDLCGQKDEVVVFALAEIKQAQLLASGRLVVDVEAAS